MPISEADATQAVLYAFSRVRELKETFTLKGGNALKLGHGSPRASGDLDFTIKGGANSADPAEHEKALVAFLELFEQGLKQAMTKYGMVLKITSAKILPAKKDPRHFPSFDVKVGYTDDPEKRFISTVVKIEISLNEVVCEDVDVPIGDFSISVASLNDIVAEKLRSILQQIPRNRRRPRDFYDIWYFSKHHADKIDLGKVAEYLLAKSVARNIEVSRQAFEVEELYTRGATGFGELEATVRSDEPFPTFEATAEEVRALVAQLAIPAG